MAYNILALTLHDQQLSLAITDLSKLITQRSIIEHQSADQFLTEYRESLIQRFSESNKISTIHLLLDILTDNTTATAEVFTSYGVTADLIAHNIESFDQESILESKMQITSETSNQLALQQYKTSRQLTLERYSTDLTDLAQQGKIDPVIGRDREIERTIQILSRRKKNNPILVGEAGVGKSAIVEGLALKIVSGDVPPKMQEKKLLSLDLSSLIAGTKYRGEFEERMQEIIREATDAQDIILFIDEIHTIVGAGATQGSLDTANILKPSLARGEIKVIGATTYNEYRESIEKDAALERRFQRLTIEPANREQTLNILHRIAPYYESHHNVRYSADSIEACVDLSHRYISGRKFPDKAIDVMDEAGAMAQSSAHNPTESQHKANPKTINRKDIELIITSMTGIPTEQISQNEIERLRDLRHKLQNEIIGQDDAVDRIVKTIHRAKVGLRDEQRPIGVFLFIGSTGVGKTLLAKKIAEFMTPCPNPLIRIDMSEYSLKHNLARLIGSPPGYVGYGEGGELTEPVRQRPYSVILLDEIEKAHPDLFDLMLQLLDEGRLTDGIGRSVDFRNTVIIMTSNLGSHNHSTLARKIGYNNIPTEESNAPEKHDYQKELERLFKPEFISRIDDVITFRTLSREDIRKIVKLELKQTLQRIEKAGYRVNISEEAIKRITEDGYQPKRGARILRELLTEKIENPIANFIIEGVLTVGGEVKIDEANGQITHHVA